MYPLLVGLISATSVLGSHLALTSTARKSANWFAVPLSSVKASETDPTEEKRGSVRPSLAAHVQTNLTRTSSGAEIIIMIPYIRVP
mmetsp:Transcript_21842/g.49014  ORF Transcript_21842/g.49014 Transcript_21842/m.49014 type:complete len:86 (+) Transcript_21842:98-355(+)